MSVTEMVRWQADERPRVDYTRVMAWMPIRTADEGWVWLLPVWRVTSSDDPRVLYSRKVLAW